MPIRKITRHGQSRLFIDIRYKTKDGQRARYRKDAQVQTLPGARAEEKRVLLNLARYGTPYAPGDDVPVPPPASPAGSPPAAPSTTPALPTKTFSEVVSEYRSTFMLTDLKVTTRRGYALVLDRHLLPTFGELSLAQVDGAAAAELDLALSKQDRARATRNNVQIVLRSVLRFATSRGYLAGLPPALPRLKAAEKSILEIPSERDIDTILASAVPSQRLAFALMAYAGLRPNEVRALRRRDVLLPGTNGEAQGGFLSVREGRSYGETHTPKTGQREIPITAPLARLLEHVEHGPKDGRVALNQQGKPWGQYGLTQAFERVRDRAGLGGWSVYGLRHFAITSWLRAGVPVHVVQRMAGHKHLSTTQGYVHHLKEDLAEAARRIAKATEGRGNGGASHGPRQVEARTRKG